MDFDYVDLKRREKNMTVVELCDRAKINRSTYYKLQRHGDVKLSTLRKLFEVLDLNIAEQKRVIS